MTDWYEERDRLEPGQIFKTCTGDIVRLDHGVPGDATRWYVADWDGQSWAYYDSTIEPGDLIGEPLPEPVRNEGVEP